MRAAFAALVSVAAASCGDNQHQAIAADAAPPPACTTSLSGTVTAPNGILPIAGATVYVASNAPGPLPTAPSCQFACTPPNAVAATTTGADGTFRLDGITASPNLPVVIQAGRWRRQLVVPVLACGDTALAADDTRLPGSSTDATALTAMSATGAPLVDLPTIAAETGDDDVVECILVELGVAASEFGNGSGSGHVQLYWNPEAFAGAKAPSFAGGASYGDVTGLWNRYAALSQFDVVMLGDDIDAAGSSKPPSAISAIGQYASSGGQLVLTGNSQTIWIRNNAAWASELTFDPQVDADATNAAMFAVDDTTNPDGTIYADWLFDAGASPAPGTIYVDGASYQCVGYDAATVARWLYVTASVDNGEESSNELVSFSTPVGAACGEVVYSDFEVAWGDGNEAATVSPFPGNCAAPSAMTPQVKAMAYLLFGGGRSCP
ncbi:MAG TPA: carboxypeptidase-like regulatory domain-containing protein [Kofleriaceae bacterium]|jgi:hypothetical protein